MVCFPAHKLLFIGPNVNRKCFFKGLQSLGVIEFEKVPSCSVALWEKYHSLVHALSSYKGGEASLIDSVCPDDWFHVALHTAQEILALLKRKEKLSDRKKILLQEKKKLLPFGPFKSCELEEISESLKTKVSLLSIPEQKISEKLSKSGRIFEVSRISSRWYGLLFGEPEEDLKEAIVSFDQDPYELEKRLLSLEEKMSTAETKLTELKLQVPFLEKAKKALLNAIHLQEAENATKEKYGAFTASAWFHPSYREKIDQLARSYSVYIEELSSSKEEVAPTVFKNEGYARIGQDLVEIYDVPSPVDEDPSLWVLAAFSVFFAMIMADMGYGLAILLPCFYLSWRKKLIDPVACRLARLGIILGVTTALWGGMMGSFFGVTFSSGFSVLDYLAVKKASYHQEMQDAVWEGWKKDYPELKISGSSPLIFEVKMRGQISTPIKNELIDAVSKELVLMIGVAHLLLSMWKGRLRTFTHWGWSLFLIGGYLLVADFLGASIVPYYLFALSQTRLIWVAKGLTGSGFLLAHLAAIYERGFLSGLLEWMNAIQLFSDVLSYLRLYALGLSGAIIAATFNSIAGSLPFPLALICFFIGHVINFGLGVMGAVVHSLRLNFLEWYRYSFEGGGRKFRPLSLQEE